jgi:DNA-binding IclR family transcriptional regulator
MKVEEQVTVYTALLHVSDKQEQLGVETIADYTDVAPQRAEVILDELEHMGIIEESDGRWYPVLAFEED